MLLAGFLLTFLQLLVFTATSDGYPLDQQFKVIRRSSYTPDCDSLPQLQWRRCMIHEGDNCRGLELKGSETTSSLGLLVQGQEQKSHENYNCVDTSNSKTRIDDYTTSDPTKTTYQEETETETSIPTTELMQATRERTFHVEDDLDDDDEIIAGMPISGTQTTKTHGTFLPRHTSSACTLQPEPNTLDVCRKSMWVFFFDTSSSGVRGNITPGLIALSLLLLFLLAVLVVEASERLWVLWNSERLARQQVRLSGPEKKLFAVSEDTSPRDDSLEHPDYSSAYDGEKQDSNEP